MRAWSVLPALALLSLPLAARAAESRLYTDPEGAFTAEIPTDWKPEHEKSGDAGGAIAVTTLGPAGEAPAGRIHVITLRTEALTAEQARGVPAALLQIGLAALQEDGSVTAQKHGTGRLAALDAQRVDVSYKAEDGVTYTGYLLVAQGKKFALMVALGAPTRDPEGLKRAEAALASFAIEGVKGPGGPGAGGVLGGAIAGKPKSTGLFSAKTLARTAASIKPATAAADTVLVQGGPGEPPLTVDSVKHFIAFVEEVFGVHFTDAEFEATQARFIEFYQKNDGQGKAIIAQGGAQLLAGIRIGTPQEQAAKREEARVSMGRQIAAGAKAGIAWAQVLNDAINRRSEKLAQVKGEKPAVMGAAAVKRDLTEASLDASMEMLYFMWVAAGRSAADVTPEAVFTIRATIQAGFDRLPADYQYLFANAEDIYPRLRAAWHQGSPQEQMLYAQQFGAALDSMGLTVDPPRAAGGGQRQKSAWDDVNPDDVRSGLVMNTCWNLAQKSR